MCLFISGFHLRRLSNIMPRCLCSFVVRIKLSRKKRGSTTARVLLVIINLEMIPEMPHHDPTKTLPRSTRRTLSQLRSGNAIILGSYGNRIDPNADPLCSTANPKEMTQRRSSSTDRRPHCPDSRSTLEGADGGGYTPRSVFLRNSRLSRNEKTTVFCCRRTATTTRINTLNNKQRLKNPLCTRCCTIALVLSPLVMSECTLVLICQTVCIEWYFIAMAYMFSCHTCFHD